MPIAELIADIHTNNKYAAASRPETIVASEELAYKAGSIALRNGVESDDFSGEFDGNLTNGKAEIWNASLDQRAGQRDKYGTTMRNNVNDAVRALYLQYPNLRDHDFMPHTDPVSLGLSPDVIKTAAVLKSMMLRENQLARPQHRFVASGPGAVEHNNAVYRDMVLADMPALTANQADIAMKASVYDEQFLRDNEPDAKMRAYHLRGIEAARDYIDGQTLPSSGQDHSQASVRPRIDPRELAIL